MAAIDFAKFKKISSDDKVTTLKHPAGHTVNIAHNVLHPKLKAELDKIPMHKQNEIKEFAEGSKNGPISNDDESNDQTEDKAPVPAQTPVVIQVGQQAPAQNNQPPAPAPIPQQPIPQAVGVAPVPAQESDQEEDQSQSQGASLAPQVNMPSGGAPTPNVNAPAQANPMAMPVPASDQPANQGEQTAPEVMDPKDTIINELQEQTAHQEQDYNNGHISPTTYKDLFERKSTLGKIGTLFGLIVGGAGAGLTHTTNPVLEMMDNELKNDLDAQKTSATNKNNLLKLTHDNLLTDAQANYTKAQAQVLTYPVALNNARQMAYHNIVENLKTLPEGSEKEAAKQVAGYLYNQMHDSIKRDTDMAAGAAALLGVSNGSSNKVKNQGPVNYNKFNQLQKNSQLGLLGAPSASDLSEMTKEAGQLDKIAALKKDFDDVYDKLDKKFLAGTLNPNDREAMINPLKAKVTKIVEGGYSGSGADLISSMFPSGKDWGSARKDKAAMNANYWDVASAGTPTLKRFNLLTNPSSPLGNKSQASIQSSGPTKKDNAALKWAQSNPNDPRAATILKANGR